MTFAITAVDREAEKTGVAIASVFPAVGAVCPWVSDRVALSSQSWDAGATYGETALKMIDHDLSLSTTAEALITDRTGGEGTQLHGVTTEGETFVYTGEKCDGWAGHREGVDHTVAGNMLMGADVVEAMSREFANNNGPFEDRLLSALDAGEDAGGDKRGDNLSAALLVHAEPSKLYHNLRVDEPGSPIDGLWSAYETAREQEEADYSDQLVEAWGDAYPESILDFPIRY